MSIHRNGVGDIVVTALPAQNGILAATFQCVLHVLFGELQNPKAAAEGLYRIVKFFNDPLDQRPGVGPDIPCFRQEIRRVPEAVIAVFLGHVSWKHHTALWRIAPFMSPDQVAVVIVYIELRICNANFQRLPQILARHGIMKHVVNKGKVWTDSDILTNQIFVLGFRQWKKRKRWNIENDAFYRAFSDEKLAKKGETLLHLWKLYGWMEKDR